MDQLMLKRESIHRFDNHLVEAVFSYLPLEDRFRFECLCKRFRKLMYATVTDIHIDRKMLTKLFGANIIADNYCQSRHLSQLMTKCPNITRADTSRVEKYVDLLALFSAMDTLKSERAHKLRDIHCNFSSNYSRDYDRHDKNLFKTCGHLITKLDLIYDYQHYYGPYVMFNAALLAYCDRLSHLKVAVPLTDLFSHSHLLGFCSTLVAFEFNYNNGFTSNTLFATVVAHMPSLKSLTVNDMNQKCGRKGSVIAFIAQLTHLCQLRSLSLYFVAYTAITYSLADSLRKLGLKLNRLTRFALRFTSNSPTFNINVFKAMEVFRRLKYLDLTVHLAGGVRPISVWHYLDSMHSLPLLRHLSLDLWQIPNELVERIVNIWPKLQVLEIREPHHNVLNVFNLESISKLTKLRTFLVKKASGFAVKQSDLKNMFTKSDRLKSVEINNKNNTYIQHKC